MLVSCLLGVARRLAVRAALLVAEALQLERAWRWLRTRRRLDAKGAETRPLLDFRRHQHLA